MCVCVCGGLLSDTDYSGVSSLISRSSGAWGEFPPFLFPFHIHPHVTVTVIFLTQATAGRIFLFIFFPSDTLSQRKHDLSAGECKVGM